MKGHVLLLDDDRDTRELLGRALRRAGYDCVLTACAETAHKHALATPALDIIVTDIVLGVDDDCGLRLVRKLRQSGSRTPIVVITAYADLDKAKSALNGGANYLIEKPFRSHDLLQAIESVRLDHSAEDRLDDMFEKARMTEKEQTVARYLIAGLTSGEIAVLEHNSPKTIRQHVTQIYAKLEVKSRAEFFRLTYGR